MDQMHFNNCISINFYRLRIFKPLATMALSRLATAEKGNYYEYNALRILA